MHFFWGGDMPHYSPPLLFRRCRAGCQCMQASLRPCLALGSWTSTLAVVLRPAPLVPARPRLRLSARPRTHLAVTALHFSPVCAPLLVFQFLDRYISLARNIGYVTIKPIQNTARYLCFPWLMCNRREIAAFPAITVLRFEKNWSSGNVQKGPNFSLTLNIGPAFSDRFQVLIAI